MKTFEKCKKIFFCFRTWRTRSWQRTFGWSRYVRFFFVFLLVWFVTFELYYGYVDVASNTRYFRRESKRAGQEISLRALRSTFVIEGKWKDFRVLEMSVTLSTRERLLWGIGVEFTFARKFSLIAPRIYSFFDFPMTNTLITDITSFTFRIIIIFLL